MSALNCPKTQSLGDHVAHLAAQMTAGEHAFITAIGAFEESGQWIQEGAMTCAQWLSWRIGMSPEAGRERLRVAKSLKELSKVDEAFRTARISYSKVRAVTRVGTVANEELLLEIARGSTAAQLERICRKFRGCMQDGRPEAAEERRRLSVRHGDNGTVKITMELPADEGSRVLAAIESGRAALENEAPEDVPAEKPGRVDGFMAVVESWFASGAQPRRGGAPHEVVLHVSAETLGTGDSSGPADGDRADVSAVTSEVGEVGPLSFVETAGGVGVSDQAARRMCCDASISAVAQDGRGEVLDAGRKSRTVPAAMAMALEAREGRRCSFPGCTHTLFLDKHHIQHWANGGSTSLDNLTQLCRHNHTFVHEYGWHIEKTDGRVLGLLNP